MKGTVKGAVNENEHEKRRESRQDGAVLLFYYRKTNGKTNGKTAGIIPGIINGTRVRGFKISGIL